MKAKFFGSTILAASMLMLCACGQQPSAVQATALASDKGATCGLHGCFEQKCDLGNYTPTADEFRKYQSLNAICEKRKELGLTGNQHLPS